MRSTQPLRDLQAWFASRADWPTAVLPDYGGGSVANLPASILAAFGAPTDDPSLLPPVHAHLLNPELLRDARVVALLVLDGLGERSFQQALEAGLLPNLGAFDHHQRLTSVFPPTTAEALTSLQTGASPGRHGMAGYTLYLPAAARVVNMITFKPVDGGAFRRPAPDPMLFVPVPSLYARLADVGVESVVVSHRAYAESPLTRAQSGTTPYAGHRTLAEFATLLTRAVAVPGRRFVFGYWAGFDMLAHSYGPDSAACALEAHLIDAALGAGFLNGLAEHDDIALVVVADHGLATLDPDLARPINDLSRAVGGWRRPPTGERRSLGLTLHEGRDPATLAPVIDDLATVLPVDEAIEAGLYGPPPWHPELATRIGDTLLLAHEGASFPYRSSRDAFDPEPGAHSSLTADEMLVPLLARRFVR